MPEALLGIVCVLAAVTVIGHGLWLLAAAVLRALSGQTPNEVPGQGHDLRAAAIQLTRLHRVGQLDRDTYVRLLAFLRKDFAVRIGPPPAVFQPVAQDAAQPATPAATTSDMAPAESPAPIPTSPAPALAPAVPDEAILVAEIVLAEAIETPAPAARPASPFSAPAPAAPAPAAPPPVVPPAPMTPRRTLADVLQSFMEESNIRWVEVLSGLLVVGSAVGLVVSLWSTLTRVSPYFPVLLFVAGTGALHFAGVYTLRRWNLRSTSRGALVIAELLVPLNVVAAIALTAKQGRPMAVTDPRYLASVTLGLAAFGTMSSYASRALLTTGWWRLVTAVVGASAGQILVFRLAHADAGAVASLATLALSLGSFLVAVIGQTLTLARHEPVADSPDELAADRQTPFYELLLLLGIAAFCLAPAVVLSVRASPGLNLGFARLSPALSLAAAAVLSAGLVVFRGALHRTLASVRFTGTFLAVLGGLAMVGLVAITWPRPNLLVIVGALDALVLFGLSLAVRLPVLQAGTIASLTLAYVVLFHRLFGHLPPRGTAARELFRIGLTGYGAVALTLFAPLVAAVGLAWRRAARTEESQIWLRGGAVIGAIAVFVTLAVGFLPLPTKSTNSAAPLLLVQAAVALAAGAALRRAPVTWIGAALLLCALVQGSLWSEPIRAWLVAHEWLPRRPERLAFLVHAHLALGLAGLGAWRARRGGAELRASFVEPLLGAAAVTSLLVLPFAAWVTGGRFGEHAWYAAGVASAWLGLLAFRPEAAALNVFQAAGTLALAYFTIARVLAAESVPDSTDWFSATTTRALTSVLAVWCGVWVGLRFAARRAPATWLAWTSVLQRDVTVQQFVLGLVTVTALVGPLVGVGAYVVQELGGDPELLAVEWAGGRAWWAVGLAIAVAALTTWERATLIRVAGLLVATGGAALLLAGTYGPAGAAATALRGGAALCAALFAAGLWGTTLARKPAVAESQRISDLGIAAAFLPLLILTGFTLLSAMAGEWRMPRLMFAGQFLGPTALVAAPLFVVAAAWLSLAVRERRPDHALGASLVFQGALTIGAFRPQWFDRQPADTAAFLAFVSANALGLGVFSWVWLLLGRWIETSERSSEFESEISDFKFQIADIRPTGLSASLRFQLGAAAFAVAFLAAWAIGDILLEPHLPASYLPRLGRPSSFAALFLVAGAATWFLARRTVSGLASVLRRTAGVHVAGATLMGLVAFLAAALSVRHAPAYWPAHRTLLLGCAAVSLVATAFGRRERRANVTPFPTSQVSDLADAADVWTFVTHALIVVAVVYGLFEPWSPDDAWRDELAIGLSTLVSVARLITAAGSGRRGLAYAATATAALAGWCAAEWLKDFLPVGPVRIDFIHVHGATFGALLAGIAWLYVELVDQQRPAPRWTAGRPVTWFLARIILPLFACATVFFGQLTTLGTPFGPRFRATDIGQVLCWLTFGTLLFGRLRDRFAHDALGSLYLWGLLLVPLAIDVAQLPPHASLLTATLGTASYVLLTATMWRDGVRWATLGARLGVPDPVLGLARVDKWLSPVSLLLSIGVVLTALLIVLLHPDRQLRVGAAFAPALLAPALACFTQRERRARWQVMALVMATLAAVFLSWADMAPRFVGEVVHARASRLTIVLSAAAFLFEVVIRRRLAADNDWRAAVRRTATGLGMATAAVLAGVLLLELSLWFEAPARAHALPRQDVVAVAVFLGGLIAALIVMAVSQDRDPLALSERGRMGYVYGAEVLAAVICFHLYLTVPRLFTIGLRDFWPYILIVVSFAGVGIGAYCERRGLRVLAEPLGRTGAFLPLLPALGMWVIASESDYSVMLFGAGLLYVGLAITRQSFAFGLAAAVSGNVALWSLWHEQGLHLLASPQTWLIPPAVSLLVAAHLHRGQLKEPQLTAIRYASMLVIYVSSTSEMFLRGIGRSLWPPLVLLTLSLGGAFLGIVLRVRAFLYLGATFVLLSLVSMVWHASRAIEHVWPWWAFGVAAGLGILTLFGLFEKKRSEVAALIERLRQWEQ